jgi:hypothetical protein
MSTIFDLYYPNLTDSMMETVEFDPYDNDIQIVETNFIQTLIKSEPDDEDEIPSDYRPEGTDYLQEGC